LDEVREFLVEHRSDGRLLRWIRFHQLGPLLYSEIPEMRDVLLLDWATSSSRWRIWDEISRILADAPVPVVAFKGVAVGRLYPSRFQRMLSDADLWVRKEDLEPLSDHLTAMGFKYVMDTRGQRIFRFRGLPVEVHTSFTRFPYPQILNVNDVLGHIHPLNGSLHVPDPDLSLSILYLHAYKSMYVRTAFKAVWWHDELLLRRSGAKVVGGARMRRIERWFRTIDERHLRDSPLPFTLGNRLRYLLHGLRLHLPL